MGDTREPQPESTAAAAAAAALTRAYGYPYPRPEASFVFAAGRAWPLLGAPPLAELRRPLPAVRLGAPLCVAAGGTAAPAGSDEAGGNAPRDAATPATPDGGLLGDLFPLTAATPPPGDDGPAGAATDPPPGVLVTHEPWHSRVAILGIGSNGAPVQLGRKFGRTALLPVLRARLAGAAVVYAPEVAAYASIPATIAAAPAGAPPASVSLTLLSPAQLTAMHATESTYGLVVVPPGSVSLPDVGGEGGVTLDTPCLAYVHRGGALTRGVGRGWDHLLVAEMLRAGGGVSAGGGDALNQRQVQRLVAGLVAAAAKGRGGWTTEVPPVAAVLAHGTPAAREAAAAAAAAAVAAAAAPSHGDAAADAALDVWVLANLAGAAGRACTLDAVRAAAVPRALIPGHEAVEDAAVAAAVAVWAPRR